MIDDVLVNVANAITDDGFDPANLPSKSTSYQVGPIKFKASLSGGQISGLGKLARIGLTRYITPPNTKAKISGNLMISDTNAYMTVKRGRRKQLARFEAIIDPLHIKYEIETCDGCSMTLTKLDIIVGRIAVTAGIFGINMNINTVASDLIKEWIAVTFKGVLATDIQNALVDKGLLTIPSIPARR